MVLVTLSQVSKVFGIKTVLKEIDLTIQQGDKLGIIGNNGAGKSTLFNLITGVLSPDGGHRTLAKDLRIGYLRQSVSEARDATLYGYCLEVFAPVLALERQLRQIENQMADHPHDKALMESYAALTDEYNRMEGYSVHSRTRGVLNGLGFEEDAFDRPIGTLSGGQRTRLDLARLLLSEYDLLLLDEPTNHLDIQAVRWLEGFLANYRSAFVIISHDRYFLDRTIQKVYEIEQAEGTMYHGNYSYYIDEKRVRYQSALKAYQKNQRAIAKEEALIRELKQRGTEKSARKAKDREHKLARLEKAEPPLWLERNMHLRFEIGLASGQNVLHTENLSKAFGNAPLFQGLGFDVYKGDRIGLIGPNGIGKSTLFKVLAGLLPADMGITDFGHHVSWGYYDQEHANLDPDETLIEEIHNMLPRLNEQHVRQYLGAFLFTGDDVFARIDTLSGGEKARLSLLKLMLSERNFLLLDEPTNHLDIISRETLENALLQYEGTVLAISHDRYFLNRVCEKIFEMTEDGITVYLGNYDDYTEKKQRLEMLARGFDDNPENKTERKQRQRQEREEQEKERARRKTLEQLEASIHEKEERIEEIHALQCMESVYSDPGAMIALTEESQQIHGELEKMYEAWEKML